VRVVVIGAGLAGLATACHLVGRGYQVSVVERESVPGGRNGLLVRDGFTFDTGPTVLTMRDLVADALRAVDTEIGDVLPMRRLDPAYRARFADGSTIRVRAGRDAMRQEIAETCGSVDAAAFDGFVDWLQDLYVTEMPHFIARNFDSPLDLLARPRAAAHLVRLGGFGRLGSALRRRFRDERLHRLFGFQAMYAGLAPDDALAIYAVITYMDSIEGVWFPVGGMHALPVALATAAEKAGAEFRYHCAVTEVLRRRDTGGVAGVRLDTGEAIAADAVVCTVDLPTAYQRLLPDLTPPRVLRRPRYSPSAVVWHVGVRGRPDPEVAHHNIHFGTEWAAAFDDLLKDGRLMRDPSRLVTIPSLDDATLAPADGSTLYVLEPVPNLADGRVDWERERGRMRDRLLGFLAAQGYPSDVVTEELVTPVEWQRQGMAAGTPFALAHTFTQTGPFRPANVEPQVPGLIFAGSGTVPGVGVPMVLVSGRLAADRVGQHLRDDRGSWAGRIRTRRPTRRGRWR
jgi:phytoene desaturase